MEGGGGEDSGVSTSGLSPHYSAREWLYSGGMSVWTYYEKNFNYNSLQNIITKSFQLLVLHRVCNMEWVIFVYIVLHTKYICVMSSTDFLTHVTH